MKQRDKAWMVLAAYVLLWDFLCPTGQTLSEAATDYRRRWPLATVGVVVYIAAHLLDAIPERLDFLHTATKWKGSMS